MLPTQVTLDSSGDHPGCRQPQRRVWPVGGRRSGASHTRARRAGATRLFNCLLGISVDPSRGAHGIRIVITAMGPSRTASAPEHGTLAAVVDGSLGYGDDCGWVRRVYSFNAQAGGRVAVAGDALAGALGAAEVGPEAGVVGGEGASAGPRGEVPAVQVGGGADLGLLGDDPAGSRTVDGQGQVCSVAGAVAAPGDCGLWAADFWARSARWRFITKAMMASCWRWRFSVPGQSNSRP